MPAPLPGESRPSAVPPAASWGVLIPVTVLFVLPVIVISQFVAHLRVDVVDDQLFGFFGWRLTQGARLYVDVWDNKPPGIYWINALGFLISGGSYLGVVALCAVAVSAALAAFFVICASVYYRGTAAVATILAAFFIFHGFFQGGANRTETFLVALELCAVALYVRGHVRDRWWRWLLAGVLCGCAFLCKQVGLAAWGSMGLHTILLMVLRDIPVLTGLRRGALLALGAALPVAAAVAALAWQGVLREAEYAIFTFNRAYFEAGASSLTSTFVNRYFLQQHMDPILRVPLLLALAALIHALIWWMRPYFRPPEVEQPLRRFAPAAPRSLFLFVVWGCVSFYGAIISPHFFEHYILPMLPPLMLTAAYAINVLHAELRLTHRLAQRMWVTLAFVVVLYASFSSWQRHVEVLSRVWVYRFEQGQRAVWEEVGDLVAAHTTPEQRVQAFGYLPGVYLEARRINATRFATTEKIGQVYDTPAAELIRQEIIRELSARPPELIVIDLGDYLNIYNPQRPLDSLGIWLTSFLEEKYVVVEDEPGTRTLLLKHRDFLRPEDRPIPFNPRLGSPGPDGSEGG